MKMPAFNAFPDETDQVILAMLANGLPLVSRPYAVIGRELGLSEAEVLARTWRLREAGIIKRLGIVVRHRELGYRANAMVVWDLPDQQVERIGRCFGGFDFVTLCYQRPRRLPEWRYNLFAMIHGKDRDQVLGRVEQLTKHCGLSETSSCVLFSRRRFKQRGARYGVMSRKPQPVASATSQ